VSKHEILTRGESKSINNDKCVLPLPLCWSNVNMLRNLIHLNICKEYEEAQDNHQ